MVGSFVTFGLKNSPDVEPDAAFYGGKVGRLILDDALQASGKLSLVKASSDSGAYVGWFDSETKRANDMPEHQQRQKNYLGVLIEGPSRVGHYFRPGYANAQGKGATADYKAYLRMEGSYEGQLSLDKPPKPDKICQTQVRSIRWQSRKQRRQPHRQEGGVA